MQSAIPRRATQPAPTTEDDIYPIRPPSSARYRPTITRGNQQLVIHHSPPPKWHTPALLMLGAVVSLIIILLVNFLAAAWNNWQLDQKYGYPRISQIDVVVGHGDNSTHPSHFIFLNLNGVVHIIEFPGGKEPSKDYVGPTLGGDNPGQWPVTGHFDGTTDMVVEVDGQSIVYLNDGTQFKPQ